MQIHHSQDDNLSSDIPVYDAVWQSSPVFPEEDVCMPMLGTETYMQITC